MESVSTTSDQVLSTTPINASSTTPINASSTTSDQVLSLTTPTEKDIVIKLSQNTIDYLVKNYLEKQQKTEYPAVLYYKECFVGDLKQKYATFHQCYKLLAKIYEELHNSSDEVKELLKPKINHRDIFFNFRSYVSEVDLKLESKEAKALMDRDFDQSYPGRTYADISFHEVSVLILSVLDVFEKEDDDLEDPICEEPYELFSYGFSIEQSYQFIKILNLVGEVGGFHARDLFEIKNIPKYSYFSMAFSTLQVWDTKFSNDISEGYITGSEEQYDNFFVYQFK